MKPKPNFPRKILLMVLISGVYGRLSAQTLLSNGSGGAIPVAVPFLLIAPDARGGAMGDNGAATSADANSMHYNPAKYAFAPSASGVGVSYVPWLRKLVPDINLAYVSGYHQIDSRNTLASSFRYFSYGDIVYTDQQGTTIGGIKPNEFAFDVSFIRKLTDYFSIALAARYIHSNLGQSSSAEANFKAASAGAADIAIYWNKEVTLFGTSTTASYGVDISNVGTKITYGGMNKSFLPTNLKIGGGTDFHLDEDNSLSVNLDLNKLLVPTYPIVDNNGLIVKGKNPNVSVPQGIFQSFSDAPGGTTEELKEINYALGLEYNYDHQFFVRTGYFYENPLFGNRRYYTVGAGVKYNIFNIDMAYLISEKQNPLSNTLRFTLNFNFGQNQNDTRDSRSSFK